MTNLCQYNDHSCFGCCGHHFEGKEKVVEDLKKNTKELFILGKDVETFRDRHDTKFVRNSGICTNLTFLDEKGKEGELSRVGCPLHPSVNKGKDLRDRHCDRNHMCKTFFAFKKWPKDKQRMFLTFINHLDINSYEYSVKMDSGEILEEFEKIF